jgi:hypothetical protein
MLGFLSTLPLATMLVGTSYRCIIEVIYMILWSPFLFFTGFIFSFLELFHNPAGKLQIGSLLAFYYSFSGRFNLREVSFLSYLNI